jgi:hypothetical protein
MDADVLRQAAEHLGIFALAIGFLAGLVFGFNPVALASIPVSLAYVTKARATREAIVFGAAFYTWHDRCPGSAGFRCRARRQLGGKCCGAPLGSFARPCPYRAWPHLVRMAPPSIAVAAVESNATDYGLWRFCAGYGLLNRGMPGV